MIDLIYLQVDTKANSLVQMYPLLGVVALAVHGVAAALVFDDLDAFAMLALLIAMPGDHVELRALIL